MKRLNVNVNDETARALETLAARDGVSLTETVRRAISLHYFLAEERRHGRSIHIVDGRGERSRELIFLDSLGVS